MTTQYHGYALTQEQLAALNVLTPGFDFQNHRRIVEGKARAQHHSHPISALSRAAAETIAVDALRALGANQILDWGGNPVRHHQRQRPDIWSCCPIITPEDSHRDLKRRASGINPDDWYCNHTMQECDCVEPDATMSMQVLYYISRADVIRDLLRSRLHVHYAVVTHYPDARGHIGEQKYQRNADGTVDVWIEGGGHYHHDALDWLSQGYHVEPGLGAMSWTPRYSSPLATVYEFTLTAARHLQTRLPPPVWHVSAAYAGPVTLAAPTNDKSPAWAAWEQYGADVSQAYSLTGGLIVRQKHGTIFVPRGFVAGITTAALGRPRTADTYRYLVTTAKNHVAKYQVPAEEVPDVIAFGVALAFTRSLAIEESTLFDLTTTSNLRRYRQHNELLAFTPRGQWPWRAFVALCIVAAIVWLGIPQLNADPPRVVSVDTNVAYVGFALMMLAILWPRIGPELRGAVVTFVTVIAALAVFFYSRAPPPRQLQMASTLSAAAGMGVTVVAMVDAMRARNWPAAVGAVVYLVITEWLAATPVAAVAGILFEENLSHPARVALIVHEMARDPTVSNVVSRLLHVRWQWMVDRPQAIAEHAIVNAVLSLTKGDATTFFVLACLAAVSVNRSATMAKTAAAWAGRLQFVDILLGDYVVRHPPGPCPVLYNYGTTTRNAINPYAGVISPPLDVDPERTTITTYLTGFGIRSAGVTTAARNITNEIASLANRQMRPVILDADAFDEFKTFVKRHIHEIIPIETIRATSFDEWNNRFPSHVAQRHRDTRATLDTALMSQILKKAEFVKIENAVTLLDDEWIDKDPRCIISQSPELNVCTGPWTLAASKYLAKHWSSEAKAPVVYAAGMNAEGIGHWFDRAKAEIDGARAVECDCSRWDASIDEQMLDLENWVFEQLGAGLQRTRSGYTVLQIMRAAKRKSGYTASGAFFSFTGKRDSGCPWTSLGNSLLNGLITHWDYFRRHGEVADARYQRTIVMGDDNLTIAGTESGRPDFERTYAWLGFVPKVFVREHDWEVEFCSSLFWPTNHGSVLGPKLGRFLARSGWTTQVVTPKNWATVYAAALLGRERDVAFIPVAAVLVDRVLDLAPADLKPTVERHRIHAERRHEMTNDTLDFFYARYEMDGADLASAIEEVANVPSLPYLSENDALARIVRRDCA